MSEHDLESVDELCRLVLVANRLGVGVHLTDVAPDLRALIELAGVGEVLVDCPGSVPPRRLRPLPTNDPN